MTWKLQIAKRAQKALASIPAKDQQHIAVALEEMGVNPFSGDIIHLKSQQSSWRRRVGNYRIFFDVYPDLLVVDVVEIKRRTSSTY